MLYGTLGLGALWYVVFGMYVFDIIWCLWIC